MNPFSDHRIKGDGVQIPVTKDQLVEALEIAISMAVVLNHCPSGVRRTWGNNLRGPKEVLSRARIEKSRREHMASIEAIQKFLVTRSEHPPWAVALVEWQFNRSMGLLGDFREALWATIVKADDDNLLRLMKGFPVEVEAYHKWAHTGEGRAYLKEHGIDA